MRDLPSHSRDRNESVHGGISAHATLGSLSQSEEAPSLKDQPCTSGLPGELDRAHQLNIS